MQIIIEGISFDNLLRARTDFEDFRDDIRTKRDKAGAIKAFEYTFEMTWKTMKKFVEMRGGYPFTISGSKDVFRVAAYLHLIDDPEKWFKFIEARNITSHVYNEVEADMVIANFGSFSKELTKFLNKVGAF